MKNKFKKEMICVPLLFTAMGISAQDLVYTYDNAGNRTGRTTTIFRSSEAEAVEEKQEITALPELTAEKDILVYPNPTQGHFVVDIENLSRENLKGDALLFDMNGKLLAKKNIHSHSEHKKLDFNISHYPAGTYILNIRIGENTFTWKIIKK